ncbi:MAG TPA: STM3941 family protein [Caulobacteraceae bacterium]|nr:STM3941 family protein [Caulobacteraceae bacterium]
MEIQTITGSRSKAAVYLVGALAFSASGVWMTTNPGKPEDVWKGWFVAGFFGLCALVFSWLLLFPSVLILDTRGFSLGFGFRRDPRMIAWRDVDRFFIYRGDRGVKLIGFNYKPGRAPPSRLRGLVRAFGADAGLPKGWTMSPEALVDLLNQQKDRWAPTS